jgi:streptomycin 6-kinase
LEGRDDEATAIIAQVIQQMSNPNNSSKAHPTVQDWGKGFQRYLASRDNQIPSRLVEKADRTYSDLCASQSNTRLLHGDLQHYNILFDSDRGWLAIDPKGVVGETEYEIGASLRNPSEKPDLFVSLEVIERRLKIYEAKLSIDYHRALSWGFAQAVLSAIWLVEDGFKINAGNPSITLANAIRPMLQ